MVKYPSHARSSVLSQEMAAARLSGYSGPPCLRCLLLVQALLRSMRARGRHRDLDEEIADQGLKRSRSKPVKRRKTGKTIQLGVLLKSTSARQGPGASGGKLGRLS